MDELAIYQQAHGYRSGHQLLASNIRLPRVDQDVVDRLSDMAGSLRPGERFEPYLTAYPLPARTHYVIARTWQDVDAPRAGCVLTRSLFIPMKVWETTQSIEGLVDCLVPVRLEEPMQAVVMPTEGRTAPIVQDHRTIELIEALFLESRQPIVMFDPVDAEAIAIRVLKALWPSIRRSFAICTFALAPRRIDGRDFDLLFAPKSARSRFAEWPGRTIEPGSHGEARHRWSKATAFQVFQTENPGLIIQDSLGVLRSDQSGDGAALRLSLLWNELSEKALSSPSAVLGMLDILSTLGHTDTGFDALRGLLKHSIVLAAQRFSPHEAFNFFNTLVGKFPTKLPPKDILRELESQSAFIATRHSDDALAFLSEIDSDSRPIPAILLSGIGEGLADSASYWEDPKNLHELSSSLGPQIFSLSAKFAKQVVALASTDPAKWLSPLATLLGQAGPKIIGKIRRRLLPLLTHDNLAPLLKPILEGMSEDELIDFCLKIGRRTNYSSPSYDKYFLDAANGNARTIRHLRTAVAQFAVSEQVSRFIKRSLRFNGEDLQWVFDNVLDNQQRSDILLNLFNEQSDQGLGSLLSNHPLRDNIILDFLADLPASANQLERVIRLGNLESDKYIQAGIAVLDHLDQRRSSALGVSMLEKSLTDGQDSGLSKSLLSRFGDKVEARRLISTALAKRIPTRRVTSNILLFNTAAPDLRRRILSSMDIFAECIVARGRENLGLEAYRACSIMISDSSAISPNVQVKAAAIVLPFALSQPRLPLSSLVVVSFPLVYSLLPKSRGENFTGINGILFPNLFAMALQVLPLYSDWDRAKAAERDLVDAYLDSTWPAADLCIASAAAGIGSKILKRVKQSYRGGDFLSRLGRESQSLDGYIQALVLKWLKS